MIRADMTGEAPTDLDHTSLRSREISSEDDLKAFDFFAVRQNAASNVALLRQLKGTYPRVAPEAVDTGLAP